jgi:hypothetical protein
MVTYHSARWGFSFQYPTPLYVVLDDQRFFEGSGPWAGLNLVGSGPGGLGGADFALVVTPIAQPPAAALIVTATGMSRYTSHGVHLTPAEARQAAAMDWFATAIQAKKGVLLSRANVTLAGRRAIRLIQGSGHNNIGVSLFVATHKFVYHVLYITVSSLSAVREARAKECYALIGTFSFAN